ncbi:MAG: glycosyltransferase [Planctomycetota bacterium]
MKALVVVIPRPLERLERFVRRDVETLRESLGACLAVIPSALASAPALLLRPDLGFRAAARAARVSRGRFLRGFSGDLLRGAGLSRLLPPGPVHLHATHANWVLAAVRIAASLRASTFSFSAHARDVFAEGSGLIARAAGASAAIACSEAGAAALRDALGLGSNVPVRVVLHGVDLEAFRPSGAHDSVPPRVLCRARFVPKKGHATLLEACAILARQGVSFESVLEGHGPLEAEIRTRIERLGLPDRIRIAESSGESASADCYAGAAVYVQPSIAASDGDRDGIPNALAEAMACGISPVASSVGGIPEIVEDGRSGLVVPPGDPAALARALGSLLADPAKRRALGEGARLRVETCFDARAWAPRLAAAVREAMEDPSGLA